MQPRRIVDSHHHLWRRPDVVGTGILEAPYLRQDMLWPDFESAWSGLPLARSVLVEVNDGVDGSIEAAFGAGVRRQHPELTAMVAYASLDSPDLDRQLQGLSGYDLVRGVRRSTQNEADPFFCARPEYVGGVRRLGELGLVCDICVRHHQLEGALQLARACPQTRIVLEHLGKPDLEAASQEGWRRGIANLAQLPNVFCKVSVVVNTATDAPWTLERVAPFVTHAIDSFGWDRVLFGSNWPVSLAVVGYRQWVAMLQEMFVDAAAAQLDRLFAINAERVYGLLTV